MNINNRDKINEEIKLIKNKLNYLSSLMLEQKFKHSDVFRTEYPNVIGMILIDKGQMGNIFSIQKRKI
jgi:hypothetical protein